MASRFNTAVVTCTFSVPANAPVEVVLPFPGGILRHFEIVIPDGHAGLTGIALGYGHAPVVPGNAGAYYSGNDDVIRRDYEDQQQGVPWSAFLCNTDLTPHSWEIRFDYDEIGTDTLSQQPAPLTADTILAEAGANVVSV